MYPVTIIEIERAIQHRTPLGMRATLGKPSGPFKNVLVTVKQTPYEQYLQNKAQGIAPVALRWERLRNRFEAHKECVDNVRDILKRSGANFSVLSREEMHRGSLMDIDLLVAVGGDGTILNAASFVDESIPVLGVNSDPTKPEERGLTNMKDERRSTGALCATCATNIEEALPRVLSGDIPARLRSRIQCIVRSTYTETRLPPALNDILIAHPSPAAVSRFRLHVNKGKVRSSQECNARFKEEEQEEFSLNAWSSGIWICTSMGSTAAMASAGGFAMHRDSRNLQYMIREHLLEEGQHRENGHGIVEPHKMINIRWNSQYGCVYVDGSHMTHDLSLGDEVKMDCHAPKVHIFDSVDVFPQNFS